MNTLLIYSDFFLNFNIIIDNIHNQLPETFDLYRKQKWFLQCDILNLFLLFLFFYSVDAHHFADFQDQNVTEQNANHVHQMILVQQDKYAAGTHVNQDMPATRNRFYWQLTTVGFSSCKITLHLIQPHNSLQTLFNSINILLAETWSWTHCLIFS